MIGVNGLIGGKNVVSLPEGSTNPRLYDMDESSKSTFVLLSLLFGLFVICSGGKERMTP